MSAWRWLMDHRSAVEKLKGVREIETSLRQDFLALFLIPFEFHCDNLAHVATICNYICSHTRPIAGAPAHEFGADVCLRRVVL